MAPATDLAFPPQSRAARQPVRDDVIDLDDATSVRAGGEEGEDLPTTPERPAKTQQLE